VAARASESVLYGFHGQKDGAYPQSPLIAGPMGSFYGMTSYGGNQHQCVYYSHNGCGTVFQLTPAGRGRTWTETVLYRFAGGNDGYFPLTGLTVDRSGNLYGATTGTYSDCLGSGVCGTIFQLSLHGGAWTHAVLHRFTGGADGGAPFSGVVLDGQGNLYGTTCRGGPTGVGTLFKLKRPDDQNGHWTETVLSGFAAGGNCPSYGLVFDKAGDLFGTTVFGGASDLGTVFELQAPTMPGAQWKESVLYSFGQNTCYPQTNLTFDQKGNLYGTASGCPYQPPIVFQLAPPAVRGAMWTEAVLHTFTNGSDGGTPDSGVVFDKSGDLFGATENGGVHNRGVIFQLKPRAGTWRENVLYNFLDQSDGGIPGAGPIFGANGALYGTTTAGGHGCYVQRQFLGCGTFFKIVP
jgi:uncharacterized repeat protein (TIGR03803 family)